MDWIVHAYPAHGCFSVSFGVVVLGICANIDVAGLWGEIYQTSLHHHHELGILQNGSHVVGRCRVKIFVVVYVFSHCKDIVTPMVWCECVYWVF